jgi:hypothetical protein
MTSRFLNPTRVINPDGLPEAISKAAGLGWDAGTCLAVVSCSGIAR